MTTVLQNLIVLVAVIAITWQCVDALDCAGYGNKGPYKSGYKSGQSINMKDRNFDIYLYYPATSDGEDAPMIPGGPFPVVSFAHGQLQPLFEYTSYFEHLSSWGFIVIGPNADYDIGIDPFLKKYATDMRLCLDYLEAVNADPQSWLYGKVDTSNMGVAGHSEGGFISLYSTVWPQLDPRVKAVSTIAGKVLDEKLMGDINCPTLVIGGTDDFISIPRENVRIYSLVNSPPKILNMIQGGWHCGFMDESIELPDILCRSITGWIERDVQMELTHCLTNSFFLAHLKQANNAANVIYQGDSILSNVVSTIDAGFTLNDANTKQPNCTVSNTVFLNLTNIELQPTPFNVYLATGSDRASVSPTQTRVLATGETVQIMVKIIADKPTSPITIGVRNLGLNRIFGTFSVLHPKDFVGATQGYKLVVLANRDELLDRPTEAAKFWEDSGFLILGGRDLARHGTWFGVTKTGRIAMVTNYRVPFDQLRTDAKSRGQILLDYLKSTVSAREFIHKLHAEKNHYDGFNVILGTTEELWYFGNKDEGDKPVLLEKGKFYGLSNRILETPWQKVVLGKQMLSEIDVKSYNGDEDKLIKDLYTILNDKRNVPRDDMVPDTGVGFEIEKHMQPIFIEPFPMLHSVFGTRAQTILLIDEEDNLTFAEHAMLPGGKEWNDSKFKFKITPVVN